jgi:tRNA pseudouridine38-40 synthase
MSKPGLLPTLRNIGLLIAYDGTAFSGWQRQKENRTVQGVLERALEKLHKYPVALNGSGRTDSGVHAAGQKANFYTGIRGMEAERFVPALNHLLPRDVRVLSAEELPQSFHARFDARSRTYRYFFICGRQALPWERRFALQLWRSPDISLLNSYARHFRGEFDCSVFAVPGRPGNEMHRYIYGAAFFAEGEKLVFEIRANAFLWKMVRSIAGTLLFYEEKKISDDEFKAIIGSGRRELAGPTLPPEGLFLWKIDYDGKSRL